MEMRKMTLEDFANELASNSPAPGGGSVAALSSSLAASLAAMVFNLTVGKKAYMSYEDEIKQKIDMAISEAEGLKVEFLALMDEDTEAFNEVMAAFKLPKETEEEKELRSARIQEGYKKATMVPLTVAEKTMKLFELFELAAEYGNVNAASDAGVGTLIALTGLEGAVLNVRINIPSIKDTVFVKDVTDICTRLIETGRAKKENIIERVNTKL